MASKPKKKIDKRSNNKLTKIKNQNKKQKNGTVQIVNKKKRIYKKRFLYSEESLKAAIAAVKNKTTSINKAAQEYGIPVGTLFNKFKKKVPIERRMGPKPVLSPEEENRLKTWIFDKASIGYPMHHLVVRQAVKGILDNLQRPNPFTNNYPGRKWLKLFLQRHPDIKSRNAEILDRGRASVTETNIRAWFKDLQDYLQEISAADILEDPSRVFNMDETGVCLCPKTGKVLAPLKEKNVYMIALGREKQNITVLCCFSANGAGFRPLIMYPYQRSVPAEVVANVPDGYGIGRSDNGWMTTASFYEYIVNCFYPELVKKEVKFPVILFFDEHTSHISIELHDFCIKAKIILYCFIAHASHIMQPLDVGVFRTLKLLWKQTVTEFAQKSNKILSKHNFATIFDIAYSKLLKRPEIVQNGFKKCGLFPFNPDNIDYSKCISKRREVINEAANGENSNTVIEDSFEKSEMSLESQIPSQDLIEFQNHLLLGTEPTSEKVLFDIWKKNKIKNYSVLNNPEVSESSTLEKELLENNVLHPTVIEYINESQVLDGSVLNNPEVSESSTLEKELLENNVLHPTVIEYINESQVLDGSDTFATIQYELLNDNIIVPYIPSYSNKNEIIIDQNNSISLDNYNAASNDSGIFGDVPMDDICTVNECSTVKNTLETSLIKAAEIGSNFNSTPIEAADSAHVLDSCNAALNPFHSLSSQKKDMYTDSIWKEHLHFPRIDTTKIKRKKIDAAPIYAISSEAWKENYLKKKKDQELAKQEKENKAKIKDQERLEKKEFSKK